MKLAAFEKCVKISLFGFFALDGSSSGCLVIQHLKMQVLKSIEDEMVLNQIRRLEMIGCWKCGSSGTEGE